MKKTCFIEYSTESFQVIKSPPAAIIIFELGLRVENSQLGNRGPFYTNPYTKVSTSLQLCYNHTILVRPNGR